MFFLPEAASLGAIRIWNFNRSLLDSSKGIRKARVLLGAVEVWVGELKKASGDTESDYTTTILTGVSEAGGEAGAALTAEQLPPLPFKPRGTDGGGEEQALSPNVADPASVLANTPTDVEGTAREDGGPHGRNPGAAHGGDPMWLAGERRKSAGLGSTLSGRGKTMTCDLEDPDMLPAGLAADKAGA